MTWKVPRPIGLNRAQIRYIGRLSLWIGDATYLQVSKESRGVFLTLDAKLSCFGGTHSDQAHLESLTPSPQLLFPADEMVFPVFEANGKLTGRTLTRLELTVYRHRRAWFDKKEASCSLLLDSFIHEDTLASSGEQQMRFTSLDDNSPRGSLVLRWRYTSAPDSPLSAPPPPPRPKGGHGRTLNPDISPFLTSPFLLTSSFTTTSPTQFTDTSFLRFKVTLSCHCKRTGKGWKRNSFSVLRDSSQGRLQMRGFEGSLKLLFI